MIRELKGRKWANTRIAVRLSLSRATVIRVLDEMGLVVKRAKKGA